MRVSKLCCPRGLDENMVLAEEPKLTFLGEVWNAQRMLQLTLHGETSEINFSESFHQILYKFSLGPVKIPNISCLGSVDTFLVFCHQRQRLLCLSSKIALSGIIYVDFHSRLFIPKPIWQRTAKNWNSCSLGQFICNYTLFS